MLITHLFHIAIKSPNLEATRCFYTELLGMELAPRPEMAFPGLWIKAPTLGGDAILHFYGGWAANNRNGRVPVGTSAIDHVAIAAIGYYELSDRLKAVGLSYREKKGTRGPDLADFRARSQRGATGDLVQSRRRESASPEDRLKGQVQARRSLVRRARVSPILRYRRRQTEGTAAGIPVPVTAVWRV